LMSGNSSYLSKAQGQYNFIRHISSMDTPDIYGRTPAMPYTSSGADHVAGTPTSLQSTQQVWQLALQSNGYYLITNRSQALQLTGDVYNTGYTTVQLH
jgi:hypothetical protein